MPKISICIPYHQTPKTAFYLSRLLKSISEQTFTDYEIILTAEGQFAENHNVAIKKAKGDVIQMMQMDDYFSDERSLERIYQVFKPLIGKFIPEWAISASLHDLNGVVGGLHHPKWTPDIYTGNNRLGSVSTLAMRRDKALLFEEPLSWVVDVDLYYRLYLKYGLPHICPQPNVVIDTRNDRLSHTIPDELKAKEIEYLIKKYGK